MIDNGSVVNIIYLPTLGKMGFIERDLRPTPTSLFWFIRDQLYPKGIIALPITLDEEKNTAKLMADLVIVVAQT